MDQVNRILCTVLGLILTFSVVCGQTPPKSDTKAAPHPASAPHPQYAPLPRPPSEVTSQPTTPANPGAEQALEPAPAPKQVATPIVAEAKLVAPPQVLVNSYVVLDFAGTVSAGEPDFDIVKRPDQSTVSITKLYDDKKVLIYGMIVPDKVGAYQVALIAAAPSTDTGKIVRSYAFADISAVEGTQPTPTPPPNPTPPPGPLPDPSPTPTPPPPNPGTDTYGMYAFSNGLIAKFPMTDPWQPYALTIADVFDKMVAQKSSFNNATKYVEATSTAYKQALGPNYAWWSFYYFDYIKIQLGKINQAGTLPSTVDAHAVVWSDLSRSLREVKQPAASKATSKKAARK